MNEVSTSAMRPAHVSGQSVFDFDMYLDPELLADPHARLSRMLRDAPPVFWTPRNGGHWVALRHQEVFAASRDWENFSNAHGAMTGAEIMRERAQRPPGVKHAPQAVPITMDPPEHGKYRAPLVSPFGPKAIKALAEDIRALANSLIDRVLDQGRCDFIPSVAEPLPVQVFLKMMGLPLERQGEFRDLVHAFLAPGGSDPAVIARRYRMVADAIDDALLAGKDKPAGDLISMLWAAQIEGEPMSLELMEDYGVLLFIAGLDTVINAMGYGVRHLAANPDLQQQLRETPALIPEAVEELLRRYSFVITLRRVAREVELGGCTLMPGERIMLCLPTADIDPDQFPDPERFDLGRENKTHIAFGAGPHRCLGSHLARLELQVLYTEWLRRVPPFRLDPDGQVRFHAGSIIAIDSLPLRWD